MIYTPKQSEELMQKTDVLIKQQQWFAGYFQRQFFHATKHLVKK